MRRDKHILPQRGRNVALAVEQQKLIFDRRLMARSVEVTLAGSKVLPIVLLQAA